MASEVPSNLKYTKDHEWALIEGNTATIGITDFAQSQLGDIVFVELPEEGSELDSGSTFGVVESIKSVSDLYAPLSGKVLETNKNLEGEPEKLNEAPYDNWIIKIELKDTSEVNSLMSPDDYKNECEE